MSLQFGGATQWVRKQLSIPPKEEAEASSGQCGPTPETDRSYIGEYHEVNLHMPQKKFKSG